MSQQRKWHEHNLHLSSGTQMKQEHEQLGTVADKS